MTTRQTHNDPAQVRRMYRYLAANYDTLDAWGKQLFFRKGYLALERALRAHLPPNGRILDLGCGTGLNVERLLALGLPLSSYVGVDFSEDMLARARAKYGYLEKVSFQRIDLLNEALPEGPFELVISTWVFEHLSDPVSVVEKAWQRLVPGGHVILLFMVKKGWVDFCAAPILKLLNARISYGTEESVYDRLPGRMSLDHFVAGTAALVVLHKLAPQ